MKQPFVVKLTNGLTLAFLENHRHPTVELLGVVKAGGFTEDDELDGVSHFVEHLLFKGTEKRATDRLAEDVAWIGGDFNAWTCPGYTAYTMTVPSGNVDAALEIHFDMLMQSTLDEEEVDKERSVVQKESLIELDHPDWANHAKLCRLVFREHPLRFNILGNQKVIGSIPVERIRDYYRRYYTPANMAYIVVGDFSIREVYPRLEDLWGALPAGDAAAPELYEPPQFEPRYHVATGDIDQSVIAYGARIPGLTEPGFHALRVGAEILASGKFSRLFRRLISRERLAWKVHSYEESLAKDGLLVLGVIAGKEANPSKIERALGEEIEMLAVSGPDEEEIAVAKGRLLAEKRRFEEFFLGKASGLAEDFAFKGLPAPDDFEQKILAVGKKDVEDAVGTFLSLDRSANWAFYLPRGEKTFDPAASAGGVRRTSGEKQPLIRKLDNGLTIALRPDPSLEMIYASVLGRPGSCSELAGESGLLNLTLNTMLFGTESHKGEAFERAASTLGARFTVSAGLEYYQVSGSSLPSGGHDFVQLLFELVTEPEMSMESIETARSVIEDELVATADSPFEFMQDRCWEALYGRIGYGLSGKGFRENIVVFSAGRVRSLGKSLFNPAGSVLVMAGNFDPATYFDLLENTFGELEGAVVPELPKAGFKKATDLVETSAKHETAVAVLTPGLAKNDPGLPALVLATKMLGDAPKNRIYTALREEAGLVYFVYAEPRSCFKTGATGVFAVTSAVNEQDVLTGLEHEIDKAVTGGFTEDELAQAKKSFASNWARMGEVPVYVFGRDFAPLLFGFDAGFAGRFKDAVERVTLAQANKAVAKHYASGRLRSFIYRGNPDASSV